MNLRRPTPLILAATVLLLASPVAAAPLAPGPTTAAAQADPRQPGHDTGASETTAPKIPDANPTGGISTILPVPPPVNQEIAAVLENERRAAAVEDAKAAAAAETAAAEAIVETARSAAESGRQKVAAQAGTVAQRQAILDVDRVAFDQSRSSVEARVRHAVDVGIAIYAETGSERDPRMSLAIAVFSGGDGIPDASAVKVYRDTLADKAFRELQKSRRASERAERRVRSSAAAVEKARARLRDVSDAADQLDSELTRAQDQALSAKQQGDKQIAAAQAAAPSLRSTELTGGLTILGDPLVSAKDLAAFVRRHGKSHPGINIDKLAEAFIAEGKSEGVRSDVAWVQSIIETGWFSFNASMVHADDYNYAGIGACDSCSRGIIFKSMSDGVRTQIQLLRTYASKGLTTDDLANPPPRLEPEASSVRGCCRTWMALSGVWATGPGYGIKILTLYNQLLSFAAEQRLK